MQNFPETLATTPGLSIDFSTSFSFSQNDGGGASFESEFSSAPNLLFIDSAVDDHEYFAHAAEEGTHIFFLNQEQDGITQISSILSSGEYADVASLQIVSHGDAGSLEIGKDAVTSATLDVFQDDLIGWSQYLSPDADILLYGCNVAAGEMGQAFINKLATLTGADIAASIDLTGNNVLNGDSDLEAQVGQIETDSVFSAAELNAYSSTLFQDPDFRDELLVGGLNQPMAAIELPDEKVIIVQKAGELLIADPSNNWNVSPYMTVPGVNAGGERGVIEIALHPDFENNNRFYLYYSSDGEGKENERRFRISQFTHNGNSADPSSEVIVWEDSDDYEDRAHYGGGLDFGPDGMLYLTTADEFNRDQAQILNQAGGKIIRIDVDGVDIGGPWVRDGDNSHLIPDDNPSFAGLDADPTTPQFETDYLPEIWAYGLRNPFRASWDLESGRFFISEVGGNDQQTAREDVHLGEAGANFGWPQFEGISGQPGISDPIYTYAHTSETGSLGEGSGEAIIGGVAYRGTQFPAEYNGAYFFTDFVQGWMRYLAFDENDNIIDADTSTPEIDAFEFADTGTVANVSYIDQLDDGSMIYLSLFTDGFGPGQLRRISYDGGNKAPVITQADADTSAGGGPLTVNFSAAATDVESDPLTYTWNFGDGSQPVTGQNVAYTYSTNGVFGASVTVTDAENTTTSEPIQISVGFAPDGSIDSPIGGEFFRAGDTITFAGSATDQDGVITDSNYTWAAELLHNGAIHPRFDQQGGTAGSFTIPTTGLDYAGDTGYRITLLVTDSDGLTDTESIVILPEKVDLTFASGNLPGGVDFVLDSVPKVDGFTIDTAINFQHTIVAPEFVTGTDGKFYEFQSWSNGVTTSEQTFNVPESDTTYTANYVLSDQAPPGVPVTSGLVLELDAGEGVTTDGTDLVTGWADQTTSGNDLTGTGDPRLVTNAINGQAAIQLDGAGDSLQRFGNVTGLPEDNADRTVFMVAKYNNNNGGAGGFVYGEPDKNKAFGLMVDNEGELGVQGWTRRKDLRTEEAGVGAGWLVQSTTLSNDVVSMYKDGVFVSSKEQVWGNNLNQIIVGAELDSSPYLDMEVATILVYDRALSEGERQQVEDFLQAKYFGGGQGPTNQAPTAIADSFTVTEDSTANAFDVLINDSDPDVGDTLTVSGVGAGSNGGVATIVNNGSSIEYTPAASFVGTETFSYTISDGNGGSSSSDVTVTVTASSVTPPDAVDDTFTVDEDTASNLLSVLANDQDKDIDTLEITALQGSGLTATTDNGGTVTIDAFETNVLYTPAADFTGTDTFTYTVTNLEGGTDTATVTLTVNNVNDAPTALADSFTASLDSTANALAVLANDTDPDAGDVLTIASVGTTDNGGTVVINSTNDGLEYSPAIGFIGTETFNYTVKDGSGTTSTASVSVTVSDAASLPVTSGLVLELDAGEGVTTDGTDLVTGWADQSTSGNDLTGTGDPRLVANAINGQAAIQLDGAGDALQRFGNVTGLPEGNADRTVFMVAKYNGNNGGAGGFAYGEASKGKTFGLMVDNEGELGVQGWTRRKDLRTEEAGVGAGWLVQSTTLSNDVVSMYKDGTFVSSKEQVWDNNLNQIIVGAEMDSNPYLDMEVATILVYDRALSEAERQQVEDFLQAKYFGGQGQGPTNQAPTAIADSFTVTEDSTANAFDVLINDSDPDVGDTLTVSGVGAGSNGGVATIANNGSSVEYTPAAGFVGTETFSYTISDGNGGSSSSDVTVTVAAASNNAIPDAVEDSFTVDEDTASNVLAVLQNDTDADQDVLTISGIPAATTEGGSIAINGADILYTPAANFAGVDTFTYTISDGKGGTDTAAVTLTVNNVNDAPTATADSYSAALNSTANVLDVLANDTDSDAGDVLTIASVGTTDNGGTVVINSTGDGLEYSPATGFVGTEAFSYTVQDGSGETSTASVSVTVSDAASLPVTAGLVLELDAGAGVTTDGTDLVTGWADQSASGNDLTGTGDPRLVTNAINGQAAIQLDGSGDALQRLGNVTGLPEGNADRTVFMVAKYNGNNGGAGGFVYGEASKSKAFGLMVDNEGELGVQGWTRRKDLRTDEVGVGAGWLVQSTTLSNDVVSMYKDGTFVASRELVWDNNLNQILVGAELDGNPYLDMEVATILVYDRALSEAERQQVENFLQAKYFGAPA